MTYDKCHLFVPLFLLKCCKLLVIMEDKLFNWKKEFILNNKLLDNQHEKFVTIINDLSIAIDSQSNSKIHHVFFLLINYIEDYLIETNIKLLECNNVKYAALKEKQKELLNNVEQHYKSFNFEKGTCIGLYKYLINWFLDYIDMYKKEGYADCL